MKFPVTYSKLEQIECLQQMIIVCSIVYYDMDDNLISDYEYDKCCKQLVELQSDCEESKQSKYWYAFHDFDGTTGFDLFSRLNDKHQELLKFMAVMSYNFNHAK